MLRLILLMIVTGCFSTFAQVTQVKQANAPRAEITLQDYVDRIQSEEIKWIIENKANKESILKKLGRPDKELDNQIFYVRHNYRYAIIISFDSNKLKRIEYKLTNKDFDLEQIRSFLIQDKIKLSGTKGSHDYARYLEYQHNNYLLIFKNNSNKTLSRLVYEL